MEENETFILPKVEVVEDKPKPLPGGEGVKKVIEAINACQKSLFSFAIMSGRKEAVELIYDLVVSIFDKNMVCLKNC